MKKSVGIIGTGSYTGDQLITNKDLEKVYDTSDEWIKKHIGVTARTKASDDQATSDLAYEACKNALDMAKLEAKDIDLIILATCTPDHWAPGSSLLVQRKLGASNAAVFDMKAQCAGFVHLLVVGALMAQGNFKNVMVVASEVLLRLMNPEDRFNNALFADGAAAAILTEIDETDNGILSYHLGANPEFYEAALVPSGGSARPLTQEALARGEQFLTWAFSNAGKTNKDEIAQNTDMKAKEWEFICNAVVNSMRDSLAQINAGTDDLDYVLAHPGSIKALGAIKDMLNIPDQKIGEVLTKYGNSSGPQVGIALDEAVRAGKIKSGDLIGLFGIGMGMQWGSVVLRWCKQLGENAL